jgi:hypothetical protein
MLAQEHRGEGIKKALVADWRVFIGSHLMRELRNILKKSLNW